MMGEVALDDDDAISGCLGNSDGEEDFCSCCTEDEEWKDSDDGSVTDESEEDEVLDEFSMKMFFKGVSIPQSEGDSNSGVSGIGVVMERSPGVPNMQVRKKLNLYVEAVVAEYLALMDGLLEALRSDVKKVFAFTDSDLVYHQISEDKDVDDQFLMALGQRILELASKLEVFVLKLVPSCELKDSLVLAQEAAGVPKANSLTSLEEFSCPFPNCSSMLDPCELLSARASSSSDLNSKSVECPGCQRLVCVTCHEPWHISISCEEYQHNHQEERDNGDVVLHHLAQENSWRRCERCMHVIDLVQGCYHMTCWCGHEFCYACGSEYRNGQQTCHCTHRIEEDEEPQVAPNQDSELWRWESFELPTSALDAYTEQERSQLALIQRFLSGGLGLSDLNPPCQSPPRCSDSFVDTIKDLHQLPWLERFVSVISDNYHEDYMQ